ncbi:TetR/AcrR family transcriptional regulator [Aeromicrobium fastidiosum]|uniref:TetR/AcrR family transcriptional regulator n=1 Tax=Aeromicrobium fastidiosum TaxID=52699 RepID=UPI001AE80605|nr:TetR/AcrR family transcriptional regulator [Aeromicrobium fastidiosum]MBP2390201.1 AcrR family transcriptional regulator [Aeromicrobium fastidiosum]
MNEGEATPAVRPAYGGGREALLRAAVHVVATRGLRNLTFRAVATQAGMTHGLVRHHFGTRDALIEAALEHSIATSMEEGALEPATGELADFSASLPAAVSLKPETQAFQYELMLEARRTPALAHLTERLYASYREATQRALVAMGLGDDPALTDLVFAALDGLVFDQLTQGIDEDRMGRAIERLRTILIGLRDASL